MESRPDERKRGCTNKKQPLPSPPTVQTNPIFLEQIIISFLKIPFLKHHICVLCSERQELQLYLPFGFSLGQKNIWKNEGKIHFTMPIISTLISLGYLRPQTSIVKHISTDQQGSEDFSIQHTHSLPLFPTYLQMDSLQSSSRKQSFLSLQKTAV